MPFMLLCVTVLPFTTRVERSATNTPAPVLVSTVALRSTAAEAKPMKIPAGGPKTVWPAVELPLIVLAKGSPNPASPIMAVDSVRKMPQPEFPLIVFPPIRSARDWKRRTPKRPSGLLGLVPLPVTVFPKMSAREFCVTWMPFAPLPLMMFAPGTKAFENPIRPVLAHGGFVLALRTGHAGVRPRANPRSEGAATLASWEGSVKRRLPENFNRGPNMG